MESAFLETAFVTRDTAETTALVVHARTAPTRINTVVGVLVRVTAPQAHRPAMATVPAALPRPPQVAHASVQEIIRAGLGVQGLVPTVQVAVYNASVEVPVTRELEPAFVTPLLQELIAVWIVSWGPTIRVFPRSALAMDLVAKVPVGMVPVPASMATMALRAPLLACR